MRLSFSQETDASQIRTDADVWCWVDGDLYLGLNRPVRLYTGEDKPPSHLEQVNLPAVITSTPEGITRVDFQEGGMMQVAVSGPVRVTSPGWTFRLEDGRAILTKFGPAQTLELSL